MRIAFVGAQGTGKTTLVNKLAGHGGYDNWNHVYQEVVRELIKTKDIKINRDGDNYSQDLVSVTHLNNAMEAHYNKPNALFDRCIIDSHAYGMTCSNVNVKSLDFSRHMIDVIFKNYPYDLLIYVPPYNEFLKEDGVRDTDSKYQQEVDKNMCNLIKCVEEDYAVDVLRISEIGIDQRVNEIIQYLEHCSGE